MCLGKCPPPSTLLTSPLFLPLFFFPFLTNWLWGIYNWCTYREIISAEFPPWPARGTWHALRCIALSNWIFPGQCKLWQIPSSRIMRFMLIFLIRENQKSLLFCWRARCLNEWWWKNIHNPLHLLIPAVATSVLKPLNFLCHSCIRINSGSVLWQSIGNKNYFWFWTSMAVHP